MHCHVPGCVRNRVLFGDLEQIQITEMMRKAFAKLDNNPNEHLRELLYKRYKRPKSQLLEDKGNREADDTWNNEVKNCEQWSVSFSEMDQGDEAKMDKKKKKVDTS